MPPLRLTRRTRAAAGIAGVAAATLAAAAWLALAPPATAEHGSAPGAGYTFTAAASAQRTTTKWRHHNTWRCATAPCEHEEINAGAVQATADPAGSKSGRSSCPASGPDDWSGCGHTAGGGWAYAGHPEPPNTSRQVAVAGVWDCPGGQPAAVVSGAGHCGVWTAPPPPETTQPPPPETTPPPPPETTQEVWDDSEEVWLPSGDDPCDDTTRWTNKKKWTFAYAISRAGNPRGRNPLQQSGGLWRPVMVAPAGGVTTVAVEKGDTLNLSWTGFDYRGSRKPAGWAHASGWDHIQSALWSSNRDGQLYRCALVKVRDGGTGWNASNLTIEGASSGASASRASTASLKITGRPDPAEQSTVTVWRRWHVDVTLAASAAPARPCPSYNFAVQDGLAGTIPPGPASLTRHTCRWTIYQQVAIAVLLNEPVRAGH